MHFNFVTKILLYYVVDEFVTLGSFQFSQIDQFVTLGNFQGIQFSQIGDL